MLFLAFAEWTMHRPTIDSKCAFYAKTKKFRHLNIAKQALATSKKEIPPCHSAYKWSCANSMAYSLLNCFSLYANSGNLLKHGETQSSILKSFRRPNLGSNEKLVCWDSGWYDFNTFKHWLSSSANLMIYLNK